MPIFIHEPKLIIVEPFFNEHKMSWF